MRWAVLPAMLAFVLVLWGQALLGGSWVGDAWAVAALAALALLAGLVCRPALLGIAAAPVVVLLAAADRVGSHDHFALAQDVIFYSVVVGAPATAGTLVARWNTAVRALAVRRLELEERRTVVVRAARAAEVERVERQVDSALTDRLEGISRGVRSAVAQATDDPGAVPATLAAVEANARAALELMRTVLGVLGSTAGGVVAPAEPEPSLPAAVRRPRPFDEVDVLLVLAIVPLVVETALNHRGPVWLNAICALAQGFALPLVRRRAVPGAALLLAVACVQSAFFTPLPPTVTWLVPGLLLSFFLGRVATWRAAATGLVVACGGATALTAVTPHAERALSGFVPGLVMGALSWAAGCVVARRELRETELRGIADELSRTGDEAARLAAAQQRAEMARELHDVGAHALTVVCLQAGAAQTWWERDRRRAGEALTTLQHLVDDLLPGLNASIDDLAAQGLDLPLELFADLGRMLGLTVDVRVDGAPRTLPAETSHVVFRLLQEALTNAARHAQQARVVLGLTYDDDHLHVRVVDSGPGSAAPTPHLPVPGSGSGLRGMADRVRSVDGVLTCGPGADGGFVVHARVPLGARA